MQRTDCNSSSVLSLLSTLFPPSAACATMAFSASTANRMSRWLHRVVIIANIVAPKRRMVSKYEFLQAEGRCQPGLGGAVWQVGVPVLHAEIPSESQVFFKLGRHCDSKTFCIAQGDGVQSPGHESQGWSWNLSLSYDSALENIEAASGNVCYHRVHQRLPPRTTLPI